MEGVEQQPWEEHPFWELGLSGLEDYVKAGSRVWCPWTRTNGNDLWLMYVSGPTHTHRHTCSYEAASPCSKILSSGCETG